MTTDDSLTIGGADKRQPDTVVRIPCRRYSRIVGYLTAVEDWNAGKQQEFADRKVYELEAADATE